jgi:hypothetical protein
MVNFKEIVNLILEADTIPSWFDDILNKHANLFKIAKVTEQDLKNVFFPLLDEPNIPEQLFLNIYQNKRILDFLQTLYDNLPAQPQNWDEFKTKLSDSTVEKIGKSFPVQKYQNKSDWKLTNKKILKAGQAAEKVADSKSEIALNNYADKSILDTVQAMINKRVDFFTRVAKLKSPTAPFTNLIKDVFSHPEDFLSGSKKYTGDFEGIDNFYIDNLIDVALASKNFFASELTKLKLSQIQTAGLDLLNSVNGQFLSEQPTIRGGTATTSGGVVVPAGYNTQQQNTTPSTSTPPTSTDVNIIKKVKNKVLSDVSARLNFLSGKSVNYNLSDVNTGEDKVPIEIRTTDPKNYSIGRIMELVKKDGSKNPEAVNLINALKGVSQHIKKKTGASERLKYASQAASALASFGGAKLYG